MGLPGRNIDATRGAGAIHDIERALSGVHTKMAPPGSNEKLGLRIEIQRGGMGKGVKKSGRSCVKTSALGSEEGEEDNERNVYMHVN